MAWLPWFAVTIPSVFAAYATACVVLAHLFTHANRSLTWPLRASPADAGCAFEDVSFRTSDGLRISGWWLPAGADTAVVMIPAGGLNRLNDNTRFKEVTKDNLEIASALTAAGHSVLMYDPRGTGGSEGARIGYGVPEAHDLAGALDWLAVRGFPAQEVAVLAWSMGCATAMFTLDRRRYAGLIADSALGGSEVDDVVAYASRALKLPASVARGVTLVFMRGVFVAAHALWGMHLGERPIDKLRANPIPTLVIHGRMDRQIPVRVAHSRE